MGTIKIKKLYDTVELPFYATGGSAGMDLKVHNFKELRGAAEYPDIPLLPSNECDFLLIKAGLRALVGCGFSVEIPSGTQLEIRSRSGLSWKQGLIVVNQPGTIDEDYRGEIMVAILNVSKYDVIIKKGDRVAQAILMPYLKYPIEVVPELSTTDRGEGRHGSTGR